ncbi:flotillin family protein [Haliovirga abyssi]|uniref:Flotillin family protein n=1 Tax=Haliovirga abyssi TaxID=2996794 RepID=A0AAU9DHY8_9FUSO|nr:hypothetical protein [Haliovirga abyssi]BDU50369.1 flotillin family protein [Haliovirga abyssi]
MIEFILYVVGIVVFLLFIGIPMILSMFYKKVVQGKTIVRNGIGGSKVSFSGIWVIPILHKFEKMDICVKRVEIAREGKEGLICKDNLRADIRVAFFVKVNHTEEDVLRVAKSLGTEKASDTVTLMEFFDAKFSEALKTVGKKFDFVQLYTERDKFKDEILQVIGTDLNGYILEDAAIDYLEQTDINLLNPDNVLDAEGIKKITDLTAKQLVMANQIKRDKEKTIVEQDVTAREAILELEKQKSEAEEKQNREIENIKSRENAQIKIIQEEEKLKSENARIKVEEELMIAEENKNRQIIIAQKSKEATEAVETERVEKQRLLEATEKEKLVSLAQIEKDKKIETENKNIKEIIKDRVIVEKSVVEEEEKIKDTKELAEAKRKKGVSITAAEADAEVQGIEKVKSAEAEKESATILAEKEIIVADTELKTSHKKAEATKILADAKSEEAAIVGISEARVLKAKAEAYTAEGQSKATVIKLEAEATAKSIELKGLAEAKTTKEKALAEAEGITKKAEAMKKLDSVGKEHEEFKLKLNKEKEVELAEINIQKDVAVSQAEVVKEGLKNSNIDIVGGDTIFFDKLVKSITLGKQVDRVIDNSDVLKNINDTFFDGDAENFKKQLKSFVSNFNLNTEDVKNLTISSAISKMMKNSPNKNDFFNGILDKVNKIGIGDKLVSTIMD